VFRSDDLSRVHRERLVENGFLQEVMKGWLISFKPRLTGWREHPWHASFWEFCARYCDERFGEQWHLSPEQSRFFARRENGDPRINWLCTVPKATNNDINLLFGTNALRSEGCGDARERGSTVRDGLRLFSPAAALVRVPGIFFSAVSHRDASGDGEPCERLGPASASPERRPFRKSGLSCQKPSAKPGRGDFADEIVRAMRRRIRCAREQSI